MATETINLTVTHVCENTVKDRLQEIFKIGSTLTVKKTQRIGSGGNATVFEIKVIVNGKEYALKEFKKTDDTDDTDEYETLCLLHGESNLQPFFVKPYCFVRYGDFFGIIMEHLKGFNPLEKLIGIEDDTLRLMVLDSLVSTFTICDEKGFVHGDLNPGNIMFLVTDRGVEIKFIDTNCGLPKTPITEGGAAASGRNNAAGGSGRNNSAAGGSGRNNSATAGSGRNNSNAGGKQYPEKCGKNLTLYFSSPRYLQNYGHEQSDEIITENYLFGKLFILLSILFNTNLMKAISLKNKITLERDPLFFFIASNPHKILISLYQLLYEYKVNFKVLTPEIRGYIMILLKNVENILLIPYEHEKDKKSLVITDEDLRFLKDLGLNPTQEKGTAEGGTPENPPTYEFRGKGGARKSKRKKTKRKALNKTRTMKRKKRTMKKKNLKN